MSNKNNQEIIIKEKPKTQPKNKLGDKPKNTRDKNPYRKREQIEINDRKKKEKPKSQKGRNKRKPTLYPMSKYAAFVVDPMGYTPSLPFDRVDQPTNVVRINGAFKMKLLPIMQSSTVRGYGGYFIMGTGCLSSVPTSTNPPIDDTAGSLLMGQSSSGLSTINQADLFGWTNGNTVNTTLCGFSDITPCGSWRTLAGSFSIQNGTPDLTRMGDIVLFAGAEGDISQFSSRTTFDGIRTCFDQTKILNFREGNPYGVLFPARDSFQFRTPGQSVDPLLPGVGNGFVGCWIDLGDVQTSPPDQDITVYWEMFFQFVPRNSQIAFIGSKNQRADSYLQDNAFNVFASRSQLHIVGEIEYSSKNTVLKERMSKATPIQAIPFKKSSKQPNAPLQSMLGGISLQDVHGVISKIGKVGDMITKYTPVAMEVASTLASLFA